MTVASGGRPLPHSESAPAVPEALDDRVLAAAAITDPASFAELYRRYVGLVFGLACRRSGSREIAEEVTSATFEHAWRAMPNFKWRGGGFRAWLLRIAITEVAVWYRSSSRSQKPRAQMAMREMTVESVDFEIDFDGHPDAHTFELIRRALPELRPRYQEAIALRYFAELSHEEAAEAMGCSKTVMSVTLHRALSALRRAVENLQKLEKLS